MPRRGRVEATVTPPETLGTRLRHAAVTGLALGFVACGPTPAEERATPELPTEEGRVYAEAICTAIETCGCSPRIDPTRDCNETFHQRFDALVADGFTVAPECFEDWLAALEGDPCQAEPPPPNGSFPCASLHGTKGQGATCEAHLGIDPIGGEVWPLRADECATGLSCIDARCAATPPQPESPLFTLELGDPCGWTRTERCPWREMYCDADANVCRERETLGGACSPGECGDSCADGGAPLFCDGATTTRPGTCVPRPAVGDPCDASRIVVCGSCEQTGWCDPATSVCVEGSAPPLCSLLAWKSR